MQAVHKPEESSLLAICRDLEHLLVKESNARKREDRMHLRRGIRKLAEHNHKGLVSLKKLALRTGYVEAVNLIHIYSNIADNVNHEVVLD